jgi:mannose-6-phosphate isomerase class I
VLRAVPRAAGVGVYATPAEAFELCSVAVGAEGTAMNGDGGVEVLFCFEGAVQVASLAAGGGLRLAAGESCIVPAAAGAYRLVGPGRLYRASIPARGQ